MKHYIVAGALASILSGCELVFLPLVPIIVAVNNASITQPVEVVSSSGKVLAKPPQTSVPAKARLVTTARTVRCSGKGTNTSSGNNVQGEAAMKCSNGMRGKARISADFGSNHFLMDVEDEPSEATSCNGLFRPDGDTQGPFLLTCDHTNGSTVIKRQVAIWAGPTTSGEFSVTAWLQ